MRKTLVEDAASIDEALVSGADAPFSSGVPFRMTRGQATVEFAVVTAAFMVATVALAAVWHGLSGGMLVDHATAVASHHLQAVAPATVVDVFLY